MVCSLPLPPHAERLSSARLPTHASHPLRWMHDVCRPVESQHVWACHQSQRDMGLSFVHRPIGSRPPLQFKLHTPHSMCPSCQATGGRASWLFGFQVSFWTGFCVNPASSCQLFLAHVLALRTSINHISLPFPIACGRDRASRSHDIWSPSARSSSLAHTFNASDGENMVFVERLRSCECLQKKWNGKPPLCICSRSQAVLRRS
ncbi:hypothetical protein K437DRAFT_52109 [Tilletiaria anomala UBC 951]|uniref:Uncharacterized protein n=1 Tax=Tilletiaria anomala (strain ATCC 24038 / CBS 436.72 / UBC 951) TaxID=1037660 RepID=A0A066WCI1_TILAU|nr:uncharacterized protein K437DRAFT_52109 [Tilletiaria anomala UBC 951]KDN51451.1 hypothetical protein K437DRAFT_52109 [Tilletiaria anomala UBC 951]